MPRVIFVSNFFEPYKRDIVHIRTGVPVIRALPGHIDYRQYQFLHAGKAERIDPDVWCFEREDDELIVRAIPGYGIGEAIAGSGILAVIINLIVAVAAAVAIGAIVNAILPPPKPRNDQFRDSDESSPNYGWEGIQNTSQNGAPIQLAYGVHKVAGQYLSTYTTMLTDGKSELSMLIGLCAGEVSAINGYTSDQDALAAASAGTGLEIDGNDGSLFSGMTVSYRRGAFAQSIIGGFDDVITQYDVSQIMAAADTDGTGYVYTTSGDVQAAELMFSFPNGLYALNSRGAFLSYKCRLSVRYREDDSSAAWAAADTVTFGARTRSQYYASHRITFPRAGKYQIDIQRVTSVDGTLTSSACYITGVKEIVYDDVACNGIALVGVKAIATEQLNGRLPSITSIVHGKKCTVYHPDDDFGLDTEQTFTTDGEKLWGWYVLNRANVSSMTTNDYAAHILSMVTGASPLTWASGDYSGPYAYKKITGNFDVRVRGQVARATAGAVTAAMLLVRSQSDTTDWIGIHQRTHTDGNPYVYVRNCVDGTSTDVFTGSSSDTYLRIVRAGTTITCYSSEDGSSWTERDSRTRSDLSDTVDIGCAMIATGSDSIARVNFSDFHFADSTAYSVECTSNPAWVLYDLLTDTHYGIGAYLDTTQIDGETFRDFADYCNTLVSDGDGHTHRRHRFDGLLDAQRGAWETVQRVAELARAAVLKQGDKIRVVWQTTATAVQLFAMSNIKEGTFSQVYQTPELGANVWDVQFLNGENDYEQDAITYIDPNIPAGEPYRKEVVSAYGITRPAEAVRKALWHCKANRYLTSMVSFETGLDALACEPGDRIEVQHDVPQWGHGGRVVSAESTSVVLDEQVTLAAGKTYQVMVRHNADDTLETRPIQDGAGSYWTLTVLPAWTLTPSADDVWAVGETNIVTKPFIVSSITRSGDLECKIEAIAYVAAAYDDTITTAETVSYSALPDPRAMPDEVAHLVLAERAEVLADGSIRNVIDVTYGLPINCNRALVYWRQSDQTEWQQIGRPYGTQFTIDAGVSYGITYDVCVAAVSPYGVHRAAAACSYRSITIYGKTTAPSDVTNVHVSLVGDVVYIRWDEVTDDDLQGYEVRYGASTWATCTVLGQTSVNEYSCPNVSAGVETYYQVKAYNTSGIYSDNAAFEVVTLPDRYGENLIIERSEFDESWSGTQTDTEVDGSGYLIIDQTQTAPAASGTYETPVIDCGASVRSLVSVMLDVTQSYAGLTWGTATFTWGSATAQAMTWAGPTGESHVTATLQFRYGDTLDTSGDLSEYEYETFQVGEYTGRYFQFKLTLTVDSAQYNAVCEEMLVKVDVPDLLCSATNVAIADTGTTTITFTTAAPGFSGFHIAPDFVAVPYNPSAPGEFVRVDAVSSTTATVRYYNAAGSQIAGACNFIAKGY